MECRPTPERFSWQTDTNHHCSVFVACLCVTVSAGALAAYNKGEKNVKSYERVDENTTGKDYSNDVVARAQWYKDNMGF